MTRKLLMMFLAALPHIIEYIWKGPVTNSVNKMISNGKKKFTLPTSTHNWHRKK